eukprot:Tbor_TRINITY_DN3399_c0_g1::TRINITY_DN3399_c0_g1_i1::g.23538::m.23538
MSVTSDSYNSELPYVMRRVAESKIRQHVTEITTEVTVSHEYDSSEASSICERKDSNYNTYSDTRATSYDERHHTGDMSLEDTLSSLDDIADVSEADSSSNNKERLSSLSSNFKEKSTSLSSNTSDQYHEGRLEDSGIDKRLQKATLELEKEAAMRSEAEAELQQQRKLIMSPEDLKALQELESAIEQIKEEKDTMRNTLMTTVKDAKLITQELKNVRDELEDIKLDKENITRMNNNITAAYEKLSREVNSKIEERTRLSDERDEIIRHITRCCERIKQLNQNTAEACDKIAEIGRIKLELTNSFRRVEVIELAMSCLSASLRRAQHITEKVERAISEGRSDIINPNYDDGYDSEEDAQDTNCPVQQFAIAEPIFKSLRARCKSIAKDMSRFSIDEAEREERAAQDHMARVAAMKSSMEEVRSDLENKMAIERTNINDIQHQREKFLALLKDMEQKAKTLDLSGQVTQKTSQIEFGTSPACDNVSLADTNQNFLSVRSIPSNCEVSEKTVKSILSSRDSPDNQTVLEKLDTAINLLKVDKAVIEENTSKWKNKVNNQLEDFSSVKRLKRAYRDLESTKMILGISIREMEERNRELKLGILNYTDNYVHLPRI